MPPTTWSPGSTHDYLVGKRSPLTRELLRSGISTTDACCQRRFQDYSTFSRTFSRQFGRTPRELLTARRPL